MPMESIYQYIQLIVYKGAAQACICTEPALSVAVHLCRLSLILSFFSKPFFNKDKMKLLLLLLCFFTTSYLISTSTCLLFLIFFAQSMRGKVGDARYKFYQVFKKKNIIKYDTYYWFTFIVHINCIQVYIYLHKQYTILNIVYANIIYICLVYNVNLTWTRRCKLLVIFLSNIQILHHAF